MSAQLVVLAPSYATALREIASRDITRADAKVIVWAEDLHRLDGLLGPVHLVIVGDGLREPHAALEFSMLYRTYLNVVVEETVAGPRG